MYKAIVRYDPGDPVRGDGTEENPFRFGRLPTVYIGINYVGPEEFWPADIADTDLQFIDEETVLATVWPKSGFTIIDIWEDKIPEIFIARILKNKGVMPMPTPALKRYYTTERWRRVRDRTFLLADYQCQIVEGVERCPNPAEQGHHLTYSNLGNETPGVDVIAVCKPHHMKLHGIVWTPKAANDNQQTMWDWFDAEKKKAA